MYIYIYIYIYIYVYYIYIYIYIIYIIYILDLTNNIYSIHIYNLIFHSKAIFNDIHYLYILPVINVK